MLVIVLAPAVVVAGPARHAGAATLVGSAATVGARAAAPAAAATCASGGPVTWAICGVALVAIGAGVAYVTRDTWMPWLGLGAGNSSETTSPTLPVTISFAGEPYVDTSNRLLFPVLFVNNGQSSAASTTVATSAVCKSPSGVITTFNASSSGAMAAGGQATRNMSGCVVPNVTLSLVVRNNGGTSQVANSIAYTAPSGATRAPEGATEAQRAEADANAATFNFRTELTCRNRVTTATTLITVESRRAPIMPSCTDRLGADWSPTTSTTWGGFDLPNIKAQPGQTITYNRDTLYPDCATGTCVMYVEYRGNRCLEGSVGCTSWTRGLDSAPADYKCRYGPYTLSITECYPLERLYELDGASLPATRPNIDGQPNTQTAPSVQPATGTPPAPATTTTPGTGTGTGSGTFPTTAPNPGPGAPATGPGGGVPSTGSSECWPNGWGWFNPAEWVLKPLSCAFVPGPATSTRLQALTTEVQQRPPYTVLVEADSVMQGLSGIDGECWVQDVSIPFPQVDNIDVTLIDTCTPGKMEEIVMSYRGVLSAVIWISILAPLTWWFWREYAPGSKGVA